MKKIIGGVIALILLVGGYFFIIIIFQMNLLDVTARPAPTARRNLITFRVLL